MARSQIWAILAALTLVLYLLSPQYPSLVAFPQQWVLSVTPVMNGAMEAFVSLAGPLFKWIGLLFEWPIKGAQAALQLLPWSVTAACFILLGYHASGWKLALFVALSLIYMAAIGYWDESMNSLAIVLNSVPMAVTLGFAVGVWGFYSPRAERAIMPTLDLLQTIPAFAYLLPILILFGFGTTVGLVAAVLYAFPPMVRNTILGLRAVSPAIIEAGIMAGARPGQLFWKVRLPAAKRQLLLGVNQTTMASLSMVIIASIIGGTNDIGWEVLSTMRRAQFGESLLAGFVIALIAMALDRITYGFATREKNLNQTGFDWKALYVAAAAIAATAVLASFVPLLQHWPEALIFNPAPAMNDLLNWVVINGQWWIVGIKNLSFFFLMLPAKIGFSQAVSPYTWGFAMTPVLTGAYALLIVALAVLTWRRGHTEGAAVILLAGVIAYVGLTRMPWIALAAVIVCGAWAAAGRRLAIGTALGLAFLMLCGIWPESVLSLYLCGIAVFLCFALGSMLGIIASQNDRFSATIRPVLDTLQTMPLFVILIPFVMIFKIGEFTALLAIIAYAIVPAVRYTEHGLRSVPDHIIEAASAMGCSRWQMLKRVRLPLALPSIMLGLNQTIIYAIGMMVIAALVGTNDLGQKIYIGLSDGDFGVGMTAGIGMAIIAIIADRITQAVSRRKQIQYGLSAAAL